MSMFGGLWKHQNTPACTESVGLQNAEAGHYMEEEEDEEGTSLVTQVPQ